MSNSYYSDSVIPDIQQQIAVLNSFFEKLQLEFNMTACFSSQMTCWLLLTTPSKWKNRSLWRTIRVGFECLSSREMVANVVETSGKKGLSAPRFDLQFAHRFQRGVCERIYWR